MAGITAKKLGKAVMVVGAVIEQRIDESARQAAQYRELLYLLKRLEPPVSANSRVHGIPEAVNPKPGRKPAAGSIPGRVLEIVGEFGEPVALRQILGAKHGAKESHIRQAVSSLVKSGHLVATGATTTRRYALARTGKAA